MSDKEPVLVNIIDHDSVSLTSGFTDLLQNKYFWIVIILLLSILIGIYYYLTYVSKPHVKEITNDSNQLPSQLTPQMTHQMLPQYNQQNKQQPFIQHQTIQPQYNQQLTPQQLAQQQYMQHQTSQQKIAQQYEEQLRLEQNEQFEQPRSNSRKPKINHPIEYEEASPMPILEEENENVSNQKLSREELEMVRRQIEASN